MNKIINMLGLLLLGLAVNVSAGSENSAKADYVQYCAGCHGETGKGDGIQADKTKKAPSDLTKLSMNNGGFFPYAKVRRMIDGRPEKGFIRTHNIDMPIWGKEFMKKEIQGMAQIHAEAVTKMRILNIMDYLVLLQEVDLLEKAQEGK